MLVVSLLPVPLLLFIFVSGIAVGGYCIREISRYTLIIEIIINNYISRSHLIYRGDLFTSLSFNVQKAFLSLPRTVFC